MTAATAAPDQPTALPHSPSAVPADIRAALTPEQCERLDQMLADRRTLHAIDYRAATSFLGRRFYVSFFVGPDERSLRRVRRDGHVRRLYRLIAEITGFCFVVTLLSCLIVGATVITLYVVKSALGIDLMDGPSFLHNYFYWR